MTLSEGYHLKPYVSVIIPMYNEEDYIEKCINSLISGTYPSTRMEVLVIDGGSTDTSAAIVNRLSDKVSNVRLLSNPMRLQVYALNLGIKMAKGEIIVRADAHCAYQRDYIELCVKHLVSKEGDNVGGVQDPIGVNYITQSIADALKSPFGNGNAKYRTSKVSEVTDTVFLGSWYKSTLERLNGFDESMTINEDYELNIRLAEKGGRILFVPEIVTRYHVRRDLWQVSKQYFKYGRWKVVTLRRHSHSIKARQAIVPIATMGILSSVLLHVLSKRKVFALPSGVYLLLCIFFSIFPRWPARRLINAPITAITFPVLHFSWGFGSIVSLVRSPKSQTGDQIIKDVL